MNIHWYTLVSIILTGIISASIICLLIERYIRRPRFGHSDRQIIRAVKRAFPSYHCDIRRDPDDVNIRVVFLYDVDSRDLSTAFHRLWNVIDSEDFDDTLVPFIVNHRNTVRFFPKRLKKKK